MTTFDSCPVHKIALTIVFDHVGRRSYAYCTACQPPPPPMMPIATGANPE